MFSVQLDALSPLGMTVPYDLNICPERPHENGKVQTSLFVEKSYDIKGFDYNGNQKNVLQIYDETQNVLGLYTSGGSGVDTTDVTTAIGGGADSKNGLYSVTGDFAVSQCALSATYGFGPGFMARVCVPFYTMSLSSVVWNYAEIELRLLEQQCRLYLQILKEKQESYLT